MPKRLQSPTFDNAIKSSGSYSDLFDFAPIGYATLDEKGIIREINLTGAKLLGEYRAVLIGMPFKAFVRAGEGRRLLSHLRQVLKHGGPVVTELSLKAKGADAVHLQMTSVSSRDATGALLCRSAMADISEIKKSEESLIRLNRLYAVLSEIGKAILYSKDRDTLFREVCRVAVEEGGVLLAWIGVPDIVAGGMTPIASCGETGFLEETGIPFVTEGSTAPSAIALNEEGVIVCNDFLNDQRTRLWRRRGRAFGIGSWAAIALKQKGKTVAVLNLYAADRDFFRWQNRNLLRQMATDISFALENLELESLRNKAEAALRAETVKRLKTLEELREKDRLLLQQSRMAAMGEMIGTIAHQWRQPLNALGLIIQGLGPMHDGGALSREQLDETIAKSMDIICHLSQTIDDFRNFFKPDKERCRFRVDEVVKNTVSLIEANFHEYHIALDVICEGQVEATGYPREYAQAFLNILMNARDALLDRGVENPGVVVRIARKGKKSLVTVSDNGGGIGEEIIENIFELYFTTKNNEMGTGIGLFISKSIIEKNMGGSLTARNRGEGAEFRIMV